MKLFRKDLEKRCAYCTHGSVLSESKVGCPYRGVMDAANRCGRFVYDPLKRVPPRPAALQSEKYSPEDFIL